MTEEFSDAYISDAYNAYFPSPSNFKKRKRRKNEDASVDDLKSKKAKKEVKMVPEKVVEDGVGEREDEDSFDPENLSLLHACPLRKPKPDELKICEEQGVIIKMGVFSDSEKQTIRRNFRQYIRLFGGTYDSLLGPARRQKKHNFYARLKETFFYARLAHDLPRRHIWYVYLQARQVCHPGYAPCGEGKRYTPAETEKLLHLRLVDGESFTEIASILNRTPHSVIAKFSQLCGREIFTKFSNEEFLKLILTVQQIHGTKDMASARRLLWREINWGRVARSMQSRNSYMCQFYWRNVLLPYCIKPSDLQLYYLACLVYKYSKDGLTDMPWEELAKDVGVQDGYLARYYFQVYKRDVLHVKYPDAEMISIPLKKGAKQMRKNLKKKLQGKIKQDIFPADIPGIDSSKNVALARHLY